MCVCDGNFDGLDVRECCDVGDRAQAHDVDAGMVQQRVLMVETVDKGDM